MQYLPGALRGILYYLATALITLIGGVPLLFFGLIKLLIPLPVVRRMMDPILFFVASNWTRSVNAVMLGLSGAQIELHNSVPASPDARYILISNHQCWADVMLLVHVLQQNNLPFPRFFIKEQLRWLPIVGFACWVLDFPFMKRYSKEQIERNPELRGKDIETTRKSCEVFRDIPVTVINYAEGTRSTVAKRAAQGSPYRFMLKPKAGGTAFTLDAMHDVLDGLLDMTIAYNNTAEPGFWNFICGRVPHVYIKLAPLPLPDHLYQGDYQNDPEYRDALKQWLNDIWQDKDKEVAARQTPAATQKADSA